MLEYAKLILDKVSFDKSLFEKELNKLIKCILPEEVETFKNWCYEHFSKIYASILNKYFLTSLSAS